MYSRPYKNLPLVVRVDREQRIEVATRMYQDWLIDQGTPDSEARVEYGSATGPMYHFLRGGMPLTELEETGEQGPDGTLKTVKVGKHEWPVTRPSYDHVPDSLVTAINAATTPHKDEILSIPFVQER